MLVSIEEEMMPMFLELLEFFVAEYVSDDREESSVFLKFFVAFFGEVFVYENHVIE